MTINLNNFANFLATEQGRLDEARRSPARPWPSIGRCSPSLTPSSRRACALGTILRLEGDFAAAEQSAREALAMNRALFGAQHLRIASCLNLIATTLQARGDAEGAIELFRESLAQYQRLVGERHINYLTVSNNLAKALRETGRPKEAEPLFRDVSAPPRAEEPRRTRADHCGAGRAGMDAG